MQHSQPQPHTLVPVPGESARFVFRVMLLGLLAGFGCSSPQTGVGGQPTTMTVPGRPILRFLALGDSYTSSDATDATASWPMQLTARLRQDSLNLADPDIVARTGWTTDELQRAIQTSNLHGPYHLVSLLIGVNNQYRGRSLENYRAEFRQLLQTAVSLADNRAGRVLVLSVPDWGQAPGANGQDRVVIGRRIDQFNAVARAECQQMGIAFVDITPLTRQAAGHDNQFAADGLHYAADQLRQWAEAARPVADSLLRH